MDNKIYDFIGVGIGPFNLSLAALTDRTDALDALFFDETARMQWHPGMLIEGTDLQVPFMADLVTFADPTSPYSFLNYLHKHGRMYPFFFFQKLEVPRPEYNDYLQWVADQLDGLHFGSRVIDVVDVEKNGERCYQVVVLNKEDDEKRFYYAKHVVLGTGSKPLVFDNVKDLPNEDVVHTSRYLYERDHLLKSNHITVIGSGQSAAEIVTDLLQEQHEHDFFISWFTRSAGIFQLDTAKLPQEFFSPDYVNYFQSLSYEQRMDTLPELDTLQNGVDPSTLSEIYDLLYQGTIRGQKKHVTIQPITEIQEIERNNDQQYTLSCHQWQTGETFTYNTEKVVLATGYKPNIPDWFMERFKDEVVWESEKHFQVSKDCKISFEDDRPNHIFTTTNISHAHGTGANNLGLSVNRNVKMINLIAGETVYEEGRDTTFQQFRMKE